MQFLLGIRSIQPHARNIGTFHVHELFWMLQYNCTNNNDWIYLFHPKYTTDFFCEIGYCCTWMKSRNRLSWFDPHAIYSLSSVFPWYIWCKLKKLLTRNKYQLTKRWLEGKLEGFFGSFLRKCGSSNTEYSIVTKYQDFYHCGAPVIVKLYENEPPYNETSL